MQSESETSKSFDKGLYDDFKGAVANDLADVKELAENVQDFFTKFAEDINAALGNNAYAVVGDITDETNPLSLTRRETGRPYEIIAKALLDFEPIVPALTLFSGESQNNITSAEIAEQFLRTSMIQKLPKEDLGQYRRYLLKTASEEKPDQCAGAGYSMD